MPTDAPMRMMTFALLLIVMGCSRTSISCPTAALPVKSAEPHSAWGIDGAVPCTVTREGNNTLLWTCKYAPPEATR
jgi:hypothetical protein